LELANERITQIAGLSDIGHFNDVLDNILVPRVVGTQSHENVKNYIVDTMRSLNWDVSLDEFDDKTPNKGTLRFSNIVAKLNPNAERYLVIACHYDSKYFSSPVKKFLGATDSAVPCAMMINMAQTMRDALQKSRSNDELSLMFVFFDGEEAFRWWGPRDSIYGARHLAKQMEAEDFLKRIDMLVLLDLLGAANPKFYNYFQSTESWHKRLSLAEKTLAKASHLAGGQQSSYFSEETHAANIEDDHIPFLQRGVRVLHVIPSPFPKVWHTFADDRSAVDEVTVENLNKIFRVFVAEYLHLE
jgi:glutaminyl-peptide cyclotransferase